MKHGRFITFEGTEGAGKSTLMKELARLLGEQSVVSAEAITLTREPGGSQIAEKIRNILLEEAMDPWAELFLYEASRSEHLAQTVRPALERGHWVLCDRYSDSSLAYQAYARGLPWKEVMALNHSATRGLFPDMTVFLDVDPALGLSRAQDQNRFEAEGLEFQKKVRRGFLKARAVKPKRWFTLKVTSKTSPEELSRKVLGEILKRFKIGAHATKGYDVKK